MRGAETEYELEYDAKGSMRIKPIKGTLIERTICIR